jgi:hypothetical protein
MRNDSNNHDYANGPLLISLGRACRLLGVARTTAPQDEKFPSVTRIGDRNYIDRAAFEAWATEKLGRPIRVTT